MEHVVAPDHFSNEETPLLSQTVAWPLKWYEQSSTDREAQQRAWESRQRLSRSDKANLDKKIGRAVKGKLPRILRLFAEDWRTSEVSDVTQIEQLLDQGADPNHFCLGPITMSILEIEMTNQKRDDVIRLLLKRGAILRIHQVSTEKTMDLIKHGACFDPHETRTILEMARKGGHNEIVEMLHGNRSAT
jgi:hypothetical protein